jgi:DNA-binding XRE family transcriptional regulator
VPAWVVQEQGVGIAEQVRQLQAEIKDYEQTVEAGPKSLPDPQVAVSDLPVLLIKWRIAQHLTQRELATLAGIHENLLQKYEQENYSGASLRTIQHIAHILKDKGESQHPCCAT